MLESIRESRETKICGEYDVIAVGGGAAGTAAALAAARHGAKVLIIEKQAVFGGLATAGHVIWYDPLCDGRGHKVYSGVSEEFLHASIKYGYNTVPKEWMSGPAEVTATDAIAKRYHTVFNATAFIFALDELMLEHKVDILLDTVFCDVVMEGDACTAVIVENKSGRQAYRCKTVIDASGDADVFFHAGAETAEQGSHVTYWSYFLSEKSEQYRGISGPEPWNAKVIILGNDRGSDLPADTPQYKGTDVHHVTEFLVKSRQWAREMIRRDPSMTYLSFPSQAQFRTTRRLVGDATLHTSDAGKHIADSIGCASIFNIAEPVFEIPYGSLVTKKVKNIFAAGRVISASNGHAWEITRTIPCSAQTGQAAGTAAALLAANGSVSAAEVRSALKADGVMLGMSETMVAQSEHWLEGWRASDNPFYKDRDAKNETFTEVNKESLLTPWVAPQ